MTITQNTELAQFQDISLSRNYYYFRNTEGSELLSKKRDEAGNPCAALRDYGSLMFSDVLRDRVPSAVIVHIDRMDCTRGNPEIAIVFRDDKKLIGLMCEVRAGTYDKVLQALTRNPGLLSNLFRSFEDNPSIDLSISRHTSVQKFTSTITFNPDRNELEVNRFPKKDYPFMSQGSKD